jgi:hypothetical protein
MCRLAATKAKSLLLWFSNIISVAAGRGVEGRIRLRINEEGPNVDNHQLQGLQGVTATSATETALRVRADESMRTKFKERNSTYVS